MKLTKSQLGLMGWRRSYPKLSHDPIVVEYFITPPPRSLPLEGEGSYESQESVMALQLMEVLCRPPE